MSWQLDGLELNKTALDTVEAKKLAQRLREVTGHTDHYFSQDVRVTARLLAHLLAFESHQQGFGLTATQDAHFNEVRLCPVPLLPWSWPASPGSLAQAPPGPEEVKTLGSLPLLWSSPDPPPCLPGPSERLARLLRSALPSRTWLSTLPSPPPRICCGQAQHCWLQRPGTCGQHWGSGPPGTPLAAQGWCGIWRSTRPHSPGTWNSHT